MGRLGRTKYFNSITSTSVIGHGCQDTKGISSSTTIVVDDKKKRSIISAKGSNVSTDLSITPYIGSCTASHILVTLNIQL
jgi:hypothetical protein